MFSDLKSRGFNINKTQLKTAPRLSRLLLVLTVAMMWAVSTGWYEHQVNPVKKLARSMLFAFKAGLHILRKAIIYPMKIPKLWQCLKTVRC